MSGHFLLRRVRQNFLFPVLGCALLIVTNYYCQNAFLDALLTIYKPHFSTRYAATSLAACLVRWTCYTLATLICLWVVTRFVDKKTPIWHLLKEKGKLAGLATGVAGGSVLYVAFIGIISLVGWYRILSVKPHFFGATAFADGMFAGFTEELLFRGYILQMLERRRGTVLAVAVSSLLFGLAHLLGRESTDTLQDDIRRVVSTSAFGIVYSLCFLWKRQLWLPIGIHGGWDVLTNIAFPGPFRLKGLFQINIAAEHILWTDMWYSVMVAALVVTVAFYVSRRRQAQKLAESHAPA